MITQHGYDLSVLMLPTEILSLLCVQHCTRLSELTQMNQVHDI
jgi:hypothetical protein